jgi:hypothetical protein
VLAGAGSGKTRVITQKIAYLVIRIAVSSRATSRPSPSPTRRRRRCRSASASCSRHQADDLQISTFHSLGVRILREEAKALGYKPRFSIFDSADCAGIIGEVAKTDKATLRRLQSIISNWKNALVTRSGAPDRQTNTKRWPRACLFVLRGDAESLSGGRFRRPDRPAGDLFSSIRRSPTNGRTAALPAGRRIPGHQRLPVPAAQAADRRPRRSSPRWATTTRRSTAGAAPTSKT